MAEAAVTAGRKMQGLQGHSQVRARCYACRSCQLSAEQTAGQVASANSHIEKTVEQEGGGLQAARLAAHLARRNTARR